MGKGGSVDYEAMKAAKTAAATTFEDEGVQAAGDNTRRRIAAANSRMKANSFFTSMFGSGGRQNTSNSTQSNGKTTLG